MRNEFCHGGKTPFWLRIVGFTLLGVIGAVAFAFLFGLAVQWIWNHTLVTIFSWPALTYWQAVGLLVLSKLFFGHFGGHHGHSGPGRHWKKRHWRDPDGDTIAGDSTQTPAG
jgi:hypothetical protein